MSTSLKLADDQRFALMKVSSEEMMHSRNILNIKYRRILHHVSFRDSNPFANPLRSIKICDYHISCIFLTLSDMYTYDVNT